MTLSGQLRDYSLPELLNTIQQGIMTGLLTIRYLNSSVKKDKHIHLYFKDGFLTALAEDLMGRELLHIVDANLLLGQSMIESLISMEKDFQIRLPVGSYLQSKNLVSELQLQKIFNEQVIKRAIRLYEIPDASFNFNAKIRPSMIELTGLKIQPTKLNLLGLRALPCWDHLLDKIPAGDFTLYKKPQSHFETVLSNDLYAAEDTSGALNNLNPLENKVLRRADGKTSLREIAHGLDLPILDIQKVAFQLINTGYIDELPMIATNLAPAPVMQSVAAGDMKQKSRAVVTPTPEVKTSFLTNLSSFLKNSILMKA